MRRPLSSRTHIIVVLVFLLSACGAESEEQPDATDQPDEVEQESDSSLIFELSEEPEQMLSVYFLPVGNGSSIYIRSPAAEDLLIDGGAGLDYQPEGTVDLVQFLETHVADGIIETMVLTHAHPDHCGGLLDVLLSGKFRVLTILDTGITSSKQYARCEQFRAEAALLVQTGESEIRSVTRGDTLSWALLDTTVLNPGPEQVPTGTATETQTNETSICLRLSYGDVSFLLLSDILSGTQRLLVGLLADELRSTVVGVPHHGTASASSNSFTNAVAPVVAIISDDGNHARNAVIQKWQEVGAAVYGTYEMGTIMVRTNGGSCFEVRSPDDAGWSSPDFGPPCRRSLPAE